MAGHLLFNSGSNESSLAPQFKWLDNTFKYACRYSSTLPSVKFGPAIGQEGVWAISVENSWY
jgi:hypothetical protein